MYFSQEDNNQGYQNTYDNVCNGAENTQYQYQKDFNQGYAQNDVQLAAGNWQEQQGFNNIGYQNYFNQGYAPNGYQNAQQDLGNYYFHIYTYCTSVNTILILIQNL